VGLKLWKVPNRVFGLDRTRKPLPLSKASWYWGGEKGCTGTACRSCLKGVSHPAIAEKSIGWGGATLLMSYSFVLFLPAVLFGKGVFLSQMAKLFSRGIPHGGGAGGTIAEYAVEGVKRGGGRGQGLNFAVLVW